MQNIIPEVVHADGPSGMLSVNYAALVPVLVKAVQQQQNVIDAQQARLARLERGSTTIKSALIPDGASGWLAIPGLLPFAFAAALRRLRLGTQVQ